MIAQSLHLLEGGTGMVAKTVGFEIDDEIPTHRAADVYEWLANNPPPRNSARSIEEIERQIAADREDGN